MAEAHAPRILLVDDDSMVGAALTRILAPFRVTFVQSAVGALARLEAGGRFDAIVCDIHMPRMDGIQFHAEVAKLEPSLADRMIFVTGAASSAKAQAFLERVPNRCLTKPFAADDLRRAVLSAAAGGAGAGGSQA
jgi:CheY-like chemotaxis protein